MFEHAIVGVGVEAGDGGREAVTLARVLRPRRMTLVCAYPVDQVPLRGTCVDDEQELRRRAHAALDAVLGEDEVDVATRVVGADSPARALHDAAVVEAADLIVVGSAHRGAIGRIAVGDVSRSTLHEAPCPVAVAPLGYRAPMPALRTVVVGFDGSPASIAALRIGARLRDERAERLVVLEAVGRPGAFDISPQVIDWRRVERHERAVAEGAMRATLDALGISAEVRAEGGDARAVLSRASRHVDLLVLGSRGRGTLQSILLGSTSDALTHRAACPVIVVSTRALGASRHRDAEPAVATG
jgi:nucleotide-binding universal stress UspA family protein